MDSPVVPEHAVRWSATDAAAVLVGAQVLSLLWAGLLIVALYNGQVPDPLPITGLVVLNVGLWAGYGLGPVLVARAKGTGARRDYGAMVRWVDWPVGLAAGVVTQLALVPLLYVPILRFVDGDPGAPARELVGRADGWGDVAMLVVATVVMAPLVEELFFRGLLLRALQRRWGTAAAVIVSSLVFALVHRQGLPAPGLFLFGVIAAVVTVRTGRLGPAWAAHVGFNLTTLVSLGLF